MEILDYTVGIFIKGLVDFDKDHLLDLTIEKFPFLKYKSIKDTNLNLFDDNKYYFNIVFTDKKYSNFMDKLVSLCSKINELRSKLGFLTDELNIMIKERKNEEIEMKKIQYRERRKVVNKTGKTYKEIGLEIMKTDPDKQWSIRELYDYAVSNNVFGSCYKSLVQNSFHGAMLTCKDVSHEKKPRKLGDSRLVSYFKLKNLEEYNEIKENSNINEI